VQYDQPVETEHSQHPDMQFYNEQELMQMQMPDHHFMAPVSEQ
jgi:hypothetical protein